MNFKSNKNIIAVFPIKNKRIRVSGKKLISTWVGLGGGWKSHRNPKCASAIHFFYEPMNPFSIL